MRALCITRSASAAAQTRADARAGHARSKFSAGVDSARAVQLALPRAHAPAPPPLPVQHAPARALVLVQHAPARVPRVPARALVLVQHALARVPCALPRPRKERSPRPQAPSRRAT